MPPPRSKAIALLREAQRRRAQDPETYLSDLFPEQRKFVEDDSPNKVALCSRRAGKSHGSVVHMALAANKRPGIPISFLALTRASAKRIIWSPLHEFNRRYNIGIEFNNSELVATFPNGTPIYVSGADKAELIERFRGPKYSTVVIDETASFGTSTLEKLIDDVLEPAVMDVAGSIVVMGTPGAIPSGYFYDISTGAKPGWSKHHWTLVDNPHLPHAKQYLANLLIKKGWREDHPTYQREWLGRWVRDLGSLVYPYDPQRNRIDRLPSLPENGWRYVLGIDFGVVDATAIVVLAWHEHDPTVYVIESESRKGIIPSDAAVWVKQLQKRYDFSRIIGDTGGLGKAFSEEMRRRHGIPVQPAQKADKRGFQELMGDDLKSSSIKVIGSKNAGLIEEWQTIQWQEDRSKEDDRFENHLADAALYAWRECKAYTAEIPVPPRTSPLSEDEIREAIVRKEQEALERLRRLKNDDDDDWFTSLASGGDDYFGGF